MDFFRVKQSDIRSSLLSFDLFDYVFFKEGVEVFGSDAGKNIVINRYRNTFTVTPAGAKAAGKCYFIIISAVLYCILKKLNEPFRAFEVAGGADTNLNYHKSSYLRKNVLLKKLIYRVGAYGINLASELVFNGNADTLLTFAHAECSAKLNLIGNIVFVNEILELFDYLTGAFDVAG